MDWINLLYLVFSVRRDKKYLSYLMFNACIEDKIIPLTLLSHKVPNKTISPLEVVLFYPAFFG